MAILADKSLRKYIFDKRISDKNRIKITPEIQEVQIGQCSVDLSLSNQFARFRKPLIPLMNNKVFDLGDKTRRNNLQKTWYKYYTVTEDEGIVISPDEVVIAITKEWVRLPKNMYGLITGRSSFSRMGIEVQLTQDLHQPGHDAQILLQLKNNSPYTIRLYPNMRIAQLMIGLLDEDCEVSYDENPNSKYVGGKKGIAANWFQDFELKNKNIITTTNKYEAILNALLIIAIPITAIIAAKQYLPIIHDLNVALAVSIITLVVVFVLRVLVFLKK